MRSDAGLSESEDAILTRSANPSTLTWAHVVPTQRKPELISSKGEETEKELNGEKERVKKKERERDRDRQTEREGKGEEIKSLFDSWQRMYHTMYAYVKFNPRNELADAFEEAS
ncbi:hypothetical protein V1478_007881 [Vespula squamosa]|uniref:Uncharacterized protein n=1 Tax=Vespula squamosa TaxID=30214 RepID=A0ABD2AX58_VESSQ